MTTRSFTTDSALQRHQVITYMRALGVEWVADESLPRDQVGFTVTSATDEQWEDVQAFVKRVTGCPTCHRGKGERPGRFCETPELHDVVEKVKG